MMKRCSCCGIEKPLSDFYTIKRPNGKIGYRWKCKQCYKEHTVQNRRKRFEDPVKKAEAHEVNKLWYREHNAYSASKNAKRRSIKLQRTPPWAELKQIRKIYEKAKKKGLTVDHIIPLKGKRVSGLHCLANLQLLTLSENSAKGNRYESGRD